MTLADIARRVDLPRATARRALLTLQHLGYVASEGRQYRLMPRVLRLASAYLGSSAIAAILQPLCERLCAEFGETCSVAVLDGEEAVMVAYTMPRRPPLGEAGVGLRLPAFCTAIGRVLLASLPAEERRTFLRRLKPQAFTDFTVTDKRHLAALLEEVRAEGYALADQEVQLGFRSLAVPLRRHDGTVVAALNVGLHQEQASPELLRIHFLHRLRAEAEALRDLLL